MLLALALVSLPAFAAEPGLERRASELIGSRVVDPARKDLGRIEELIVDMRAERVAYAVLAFGGFAGVAHKQYALPMDAFTPAPFGETLMTVELTKDELLLRPGIDNTGIPDGEAEYWRGLDGWHEREAPRELPRPALREFVRGSKLLGKEVVARTGDEVGEIRDFTVYLPTGNVREVLLEGDEGGRFAVAPARLLVPSSGEEAVLNVNTWPPPTGVPLPQSRR